MKIWAIIPVKSLQQTKGRLAGVLTPQARSELTLGLFTRLLNVLQDVFLLEGCIVVTGDADIGAVARRNGCLVLTEQPPVGLNTAVQQGIHFAQAQGATHAVIIPSDLPLVEASDIYQFIEGFEDADLVLCSDEQEEGTNMLGLRLLTPFQFSYGNRSFYQHQLQGNRQRLRTALIINPRLQFDLDTEADWHAYQQHLFSTEWK